MKHKNNDIIELEKYKSVFDNSLDVIMITNGTDGEIVDINKASENVLGFSPQELIGKHFSVLFADISENQKKSLIDELKIYGSVLSYKHIKKKDGSVCFMDLTLNIIEFSGRKYVLSNFRDASERKAFEQKLQKYSEKLKQLNISKDKLFSIISHDMKNAFTGLLGYSDLLTRFVEESNTEQIWSLASEINGTAKNIFNLFDNLLQWASFNTGRFNYSPEQFDTFDLISETVDILSMNASKKNISIEILPESSPVNVFADYNMIRSVIQNLLANAIKFTNESGKIVVSVSSGKSDVFISVSDNGIGIEETRIKELFLLETARSTPGSSNERGTGLGLILCKELIEKNNGLISVESKLGSGSKFTVSLPKQNFI